MNFWSIYFFKHFWETQFWKLLRPCTLVVLEISQNRFGFFINLALAKFWVGNKIYDDPTASNIYIYISFWPLLIKVAYSEKVFFIIQSAKSLSWNFQPKFMILLIQQFCRGRSWSKKRSEIKQPLLFSLLVESFYSIKSGSSIITSNIV